MTGARLGAALSLLLTGCGVAAAAGPPAQVDAARIARADSEPGNWLTHGRTYDEQRFSPLDQINDRNAGTLGLAWFADLNMHRGEEATPLVIDGVLYVSTAWSTVRAFDARTGASLWTFDPKVPRDTLVKACCDGVNRGVAAWGGRLFVGTLDGRLIAIDAATGHEAWSVVTTDPSKPYTITGAPRVVRGKVIIGNGGADMGDARGYVSAYDAQTGKMAWRFFVVPGDPGRPPENAAMAAALRTWKGNLWWKRGGGGNPWDAIAYDPGLDLLYIGTGNGGPWNHSARSPGGGDNLYLSSVVALRPDTGEYVWHYQETPGDDWDYTATQPIILADLTIAGRKRKVLLHAPKNGFFYVLDRATGKLISAEKFAPVNWASRIDLATGRPVENPDARYDETHKPYIVWPSSRGAHSWQPMSFDPRTGLVYIPVQDTSQAFAEDQGFAPTARGFNSAIMTPSPKVAGERPRGKSYLLAWDPVRQHETWRVELGRPSGGGALSTAGNLVVQGRGDESVSVYRADTGALLWQKDVQSTTMAGPVTYLAGGEQYIAVMSGCGGDFSDICGLAHPDGTAPIVDRLLVFKLGGSAQLPARPARIANSFDLPAEHPAAALIERGRPLYYQYCEMCHGGEAASSGLNPDLRYSHFLKGEGLYSVLLDGALRSQGMASFAGVLERREVDAIRAFVIDRAQAAATAAAGNAPSH